MGHLKWENVIRKTEPEDFITTDQKKLRRCAMKGYNTDCGFMGYVDGRYILFASEGDYMEYKREQAA